MTECGNPLFGDWGDCPRAQGARFMPTPIGEPCLVCRDLVARGDVGELVPDVGEHTVTVRAVHRECLLLDVVGHTYGVCGCTNYAGQPTKRAAALELWLRVMAKYQPRGGAARLHGPVS